MIYSVVSTLLFTNKLEKCYKNSTTGYNSEKEYQMRIQNFRIEGGAKDVSARMAYQEHEVLTNGVQVRFKGPGSSGDAIRAFC